MPLLLPLMPRLLLLLLLLLPVLGPLLQPLLWMPRAPGGPTCIGGRSGEQATVLPCPLKLQPGIDNDIDDAGVNAVRVSTRRGDVLRSRSRHRGGSPGLSKAGRWHAGAAGESPEANCQPVARKTPGSCELAGAPLPAACAAERSIASRAGLAQAQRARLQGCRVHLRQRQRPLALQRCPVMLFSYLSQPAWCSCRHCGPGPARNCSGAVRGN